MLQVDLATQVEISVRLVGAAVLGGAVGYERERHTHPAGLRTHLLVSLGSAVFTVLSIFAFELPPAPNGAIPVDPSRVAAQIVTGIGFLGAGAIIKYGTTIKGLTTAASLWATAAIGMATGAGAWVVAFVGTAIILVSLWPLHAVVERVRRGAGTRIIARFEITDIAAVAAIAGEASNRRIEISEIRTTWREGGYQLDAELRLPAGAVPAEVMQAFAAIKDVRLVEARRNGIGHEEE
jgi:putative Mg2+ transporter-C (MgtC) family protein